MFAQMLITMKDISPKTFSIPDSTHIRVITVDDTIEGKYQCIYASIPVALECFGICKLLSVKDRLMNK